MWENEILILKEYSIAGEVLIVEATKMIGDGELVLTGQLGDVMKESATLALSWIRSNSKKVCDFPAFLLRLAIGYLFLTRP